jgi:hypothetical protein
MMILGIHGLGNRRQKKKNRVANLCGLNGKTSDCGD